MWYDAASLVAFVANFELGAVSVMELGILSLLERANPAVICVVTFVLLSGLVDVAIFTGIVIFLSV